MTYEATLLEIRTGLQSARRKRSADKLNEYLNMEGIQKWLTNNTLKKVGYTWNDVFDDIHNYILKETEKCESKMFEKTTAPLASTLLNLCVARANKGKAYIDCPRITNACLLILNDGRLKAAIGDAYLNLLYKHVLTQAHYLRLILSSTWEDLLDVCLTACVSKYSKLDNFAKLRLVLLVMKSATSYTQFVIPLRDALPKWKRCFFKTGEDKKSQEVIVEIMVLLLETLSSECRLSLCHFMESVLTSIFQFKFYDQNMDLKKKALLFQLLYYDVTLHHPLGRTKDQEGSMADDWDVWNKQLNSILELVCIEISFVQKTRKPTDELLKQYDNFYHLAAAVYFQIFSQVESVVNDVESSSKRQKVTRNRNKTFCDLTEELRQNYLPWLGIIDVYIKYYGECVSIDEYIGLMNVIQTLLASSTIITWDIMEQLACTVLKKFATHISSGENEYASLIVSIWNACVRNSTAVNVAHKASHRIMRCILELDIINYNNTSSLFKLYTEKSMPVTGDSAMTLRKVFHKFFSKYSSEDIRSKCVDWLTSADITAIDIQCVKELIMALISNQNINVPKTFNTPSQNVLYDTLFNSNEKAILFNQFELKMKDPIGYSATPEHQYEVNSEIEQHVTEYFKDKIKNFNITHAKSKNNVKIIEFMKLINAVVVYLDIVLRNVTKEQFKEWELYSLMKNGLTQVFVTAENILNSDDSMHVKISILQTLRDMFLTDVGTVMSTEIDSIIYDNLFDSIKANLKIDIKADDEDIVYASDEKEINAKTLKHNSVIAIAAYCTKKSDKRMELLAYILKHKHYNFEFDASCLFHCFEILTDSHEPPMNLIFSLMLHMCRNSVLNKDPESSSQLLKNLIKVLDKAWVRDFSSTEKQNCLIMLKGYRYLCEEQKHYPPKVAALIYECIARIATFNLRHRLDLDDALTKAIERTIKGDIYSLRIYCCYLLKLYGQDLPEEDTTYLISELSDIFNVNVVSGQEQFLKDELANRTLTILHCYLSLAQAKHSLIHQLVTIILKQQKDKSLNINFVKKALKEIGNVTGIKRFEQYVDRHIISILYFWMTNKYSIDDLPVQLLGSDSLTDFKKRHMEWIIAADIVWLKSGIVSDCDFVKQLQDDQGVKNIMEKCFMHIFVLCLPYLATEKYTLGYRGLEGVNDFKKSLASAHTAFKLLRQILGNEKWNKLFIQNLGHIVLATALNFSDRKEANQMFSIVIPEETRPYGIPHVVFSAVLDFLGDLTGRNTIEYLCEKQPTALFQALFKVWKNVQDENVIEFKVMALNAFISFFELVTLGFPSDAFICSFVCNSFTHGMKEAPSTEEIRVFAKGTRIVLEKLLPTKLHVVRQSVSRLVPMLSLINKEGPTEEIDSLLRYITVEMKSFTDVSQDFVDSINAISQSNMDCDQVVHNCDTKFSFTEKVKTQTCSLTSPSPEIMLNLHKLLKANKHYVKSLYQEISSQGFSEVCTSSPMHQLIYALSNILKSVQYNEKIIVEACNCLSNIGTYDLKTLVTVPPPTTHRIIDLDPKLFIACVVLKSLSEVLFDGDPILTDKVVQTLSTLFKFREGSNALELEQVDNLVFKPLTTQNVAKSGDIKINSRKCDQYCAENVDGIFTRAFTKNWDSNDTENHSKWLKRVTADLLGLLDSPTNYFDDLQDVCATKSSVCRKILPALIGLILQISTEKHVQIMSTHINNIFDCIWELTFDGSVESSGDSTHIVPKKSVLDVGQKMVIQYMLHIVDFVRLQRRYYGRSSQATVESLNYLNLDYAKVAWAATMADQNLVAIYYGELWAVAQNDGIPPAAPEATTNLPGGENIQQIFRKCYVSIGELDAVEGCGTAHLTIESEKRRHLVSTGQYQDALLVHDIALAGDGPSPALHRGALTSLQRAGMHHLALHYIKSLPDKEQLSDIKYECMTFLGDWSEIVDTEELQEKSKLPNSNPLSIIKAFHYACLKDCLDVQATDFRNKSIPLDRAKLAVSRLCQKLNMENCQSVYKVVSKLHLFSDIEDYFSVRSGDMSPRQLLSQWEVNNLPAFKDFKHLESVISQRVLILEHAAKTHHDLQNEIVSLQLQYAKLGLSNDRVQMAQRMVAVVKKLQSSEEVALLESEIAWAKGHKDIALSLLRNLLSNASQDVNLTARSLRQYALWMAETKRDNARNIIDKYLLKSLNVLDESRHVDTRRKIYHDIAKFADAEYKQVVAYMNSSVYENKVQCLENMKGTASSLRSTQNLTSDERKVLNTHERFKDLDENEIHNTQLEKESFLNLAMRYYLLSLKECEENNLSVFRMISLWLDNPGFEFTKEDNCTVFGLLSQIPSRKFVTVLPQLAPRLTTDDNKFAKILRNIIKKCALEHPHHTLPILFALKNCDKDHGAVSAEERAAAAAACVRDLAAAAALHAPILQMELLCDATISFANYQPSRNNKDTKIPSSQQLHKLRNLDAIPIPTVTIPIRNDCKYTDFPSLVAFENNFELVGGINCPKKVVCTDSTGKKRILLIKGKDDMRQDAVMQQVFSIVNTLLEKNSVTSRNKLLIRTYKVVPMSKQSGVLEWCEGTMPVGEYLTGTRAHPARAAHARYRPKDISCHAAREKLTHCYSVRSTNKEKLAVFLKILQHFKPVFHYFFTEHYLDPVTWYERRLAYTRSVATSSMVGYIMGLGDRHVQNILIDKKTAEVIHIDFGIAFDLGKILPTPETIPFRLTQDIIAGFGSSGVEGIFRGCCEKTMQLLRENSETLLTILEVLLYDPLYTWTVSTAQQNVNHKTDLPKGGSGASSGLAKRALLSVASKLSGAEGGAGGVDVRGQVARLLRQAVDPANLSRLYPGWQPYL